MVEADNSSRLRQTAVVPAVAERENTVINNISSEIELSNEATLKSKKKIIIFSPVAEAEAEALNCHRNKRVTAAVVLVVVAEHSHIAFVAARSRIPVAGAEHNHGLVVGLLVVVVAEYIQVVSARKAAAVGVAAAYS